MWLFNQTFEYLTHNIVCPTNADFEGLDYKSSEYKRLEGFKEHWNLMLNQLGAVGWELIAVEDEPSAKRDVTVKKCIFKRSSRSNHFGTGIGVDEFAVGDLAKARVKKERLALEPTTD